MSRDPRGRARVRAQYSKPAQCSNRQRSGLRAVSPELPLRPRYGVFDVGRAGHNVVGHEQRRLGANGSPAGYARHVVVGQQRLPPGAFSCSGGGHGSFDDGPERGNGAIRQFLQHACKNVRASSRLICRRWLLMPRAGRPRQRLRDTVNLHVDGGNIGIQAWPGQTRPLPWRGLNSNPEIIAVQTLV